MYNYNASNELTSNSNGSYTYDNNGNTSTDAQGRSFTWDFENRLVQAIVSGQNGGTTTFKYDPFGRRIQKSGPLGTTNYLYDGPGIVEEMDNTSSQVAAYVQGIGVDQPLSEFRSGSASYYEADGLGSITTLTNVSGTTAATYVYDSFGSLSASTGSVTNPFRYTSREFDAEIGLSFYRARYYGSSIGRFANEDPLGLAGDGTNFYIYVNNSPIVFIDPSGLAHCAAGADCNFTPEMRDALACSTVAPTAITKLLADGAREEASTEMAKHVTSTEPTTEISKGLSWSVASCSASRMGMVKKSTIVLPTIPLIQQIQARTITFK